MPSSFRADGSHLAELENSPAASSPTSSSTPPAPKSMSTCFDYAAFTGRVVYVGITTSDLTFPHAAGFPPPRTHPACLAQRDAGGFRQHHPL
jgi:hypothetical protein